MSHNDQSSSSPLLDSKPLDLDMSSSLGGTIFIVSAPTNQVRPALTGTHRRESREMPARKNLASERIFEKPSVDERVHRSSSHNFCRSVNCDRFARAAKLFCDWVFQKAMPNPLPLIPRASSVRGRSSADPHQVCMRFDRLRCPDVALLRLPLLPQRRRAEATSRVLPDLAAAPSGALNLAAAWSSFLLSSRMRNSLLPP